MQLQYVLTYMPQQTVISMTSISKGNFKTIGSWTILLV